MKNILSSLTESEKNRILEMHKSATQRNYLTESLAIPQGLQKNVVPSTYECNDTPELKNGFDFLKNCFEVTNQEVKMKQGMGSSKMRVFRYKDPVVNNGVRNSDYYVGYWNYAIDCMEKLYGDLATLGPDPKENETGEAVGGGMKIDVGTVFENGLKILQTPKVRQQNDDTVVWMMTDEKGTGNEFSCKRHENGKYFLFPTGNGKYKLTQGESQALYNKYCKK